MFIKLIQGRNVRNIWDIELAELSRRLLYSLTFQALCVYETAKGSPGMCFLLCARHADMPIDRFEGNKCVDHSLFPFISRQRFLFPSNHALLAQSYKDNSDRRTYQYHNCRDLAEGNCSLSLPHCWLLWGVPKASGCPVYRAGGTLASIFWAYRLWYCRGKARVWDVDSCC